MRRSNFALRLQPSLMDEARKAAQAEGVALNQLINVAVAEKVSTLRTEDYFRERASRADRGAALRALDRAGKGNPPLSGDELPSKRSHSKSGAKTERQASKKRRRESTGGRKRSPPQIAAATIQEKRTGLKTGHYKSKRTRPN